MQSFSVKDKILTSSLLLAVCWLASASLAGDPSGYYPGYDPAGMYGNAQAMPYGPAGYDQQQQMPQAQMMPPYGGNGAPFLDPSAVAGAYDVPVGPDQSDPLVQALALHEAGRFADAIALYETVLDKTTPDPRIYASVAEAHLRLGNTERALKYAVEALKLDPNYASGHLLLGAIMIDLNDLNRAIRSFERVIVLDGNNPYSYYNLGLIYFGKAQVHEAIEYFERAKDLNPNDPKIWNNLGVAHYDQGDFTKAGAYFSQALSLDPEFTSASKNLALVAPYLPKPKAPIRAKSSSKTRYKKKKSKPVKKAAVTKPIAKPDSKKETEVKQ